MSFGAVLTEIDLSYFGSTAIIGENIDTGGSNGCGKTTIINAICYALYNKPFDNISLQRLINSTNNSKNTLMEVRLILRKGEDEYEIYRCRGETFNIQILCNGEDITLDSVTGNDKLVQEIVGMSYELFTKIIIFSGNSTPFLVLPVSQQRAQIEELFNITLLTEKALVLKERIKQTESDINVQEAIIKQQENAVTLHNKQIVDAGNRVTRWDYDRVSQVTRLEHQLSASDGVDMVREKELHELISHMSSELSRITVELKEVTQSKNQSTTKVKKLSAELEHLIAAKCPYCLQKYESAEQKIAEVTAELNNEEQELALYSKAVVDSTISRDLLTQEINVHKEDRRFDSYAAALQAQQAASSAQQKIDDLNNSINPHNEALETLEGMTFEIQRDDLNALKKELDHQQFLLKLLTDKNSFIRRRIINQTIPFLNGRLNGYTRELGLQHIVKFDDDMSCVVSEYGRELDFGNLSSGEKKRVNLSLSLAFRDVLHHLHAKVNCLFIDEIDASLDNSGVEAVFKLLKAKTRDDGLGMWIISHRPEAVGKFDRVVIVRKISGFSSIVLDE